MLSLNKLLLETEGPGLDAKVLAGQLAVFVLNREELCGEFVNILLGLSLPLNGTLSVFDQHLSQLSEKDQIPVIQRIGIVAARLGLIANLNVMENLVLAADYHAMDDRAEIRQRALRLLERVGYEDSPYGALGKLSRAQQTQVCLVRALMLDPDLLIYATLFDGLSSRDADTLLDKVLEIHRYKQRRTTIFLTPDQKFVARLPAETQVFCLQSEG
ncbi:MAG: ATP-binding cassette domain-containing protein [Deltaproteobacteria bacterium]|nr:ATP-binding cassette domain-containing protein [Deltaproteobacteria bacterium]